MVMYMTCVDLWIFPAIGAYLDHVQRGAQETHSQAGEQWLEKSVLLGVPRERAGREANMILSA